MQKPENNNLILNILPRNSRHLDFREIPETIVLQTFTQLCLFATVKLLNYGVSEVKESWYISQFHLA